MMNLAVIIAALQIILLLIVRREDFSRFPAYRAFFCFQGVATPVVLLSLNLGRMAYFDAFYASTISQDVLIFFVAYEAYSHVFGPRFSLPRMVPERTGAMIAVAFSIAVALTVVAGSTNGGWRTRLMVDAEQMLSVAAWGTFAILCVYSYTLRIHWPRRIAGISVGFVLYLTIAVVTIFVRARAGKDVSLLAGRVGQSAYLLSLGWWCWCFKEKEPVPVPATPEQILEIKRWHERTVEEMRRAGVQV